MSGLSFAFQKILPLEIILADKSLIAVDEGGYVQLIKENHLFYKIQ